MCKYVQSINIFEHNQKFLQLKQEVDEKKNSDAVDMVNSSPMSIIRHNSVSPEPQPSITNEVHYHFILFLKNTSDCTNAIV